MCASSPWPAELRKFEAPASASLPDGQQRVLLGCDTAPSTMAASTRAPPTSLQASMLSARTSAEPARAVTGMAAVVRPASQVSTSGSPRYQSHRQKTLAESAYHVPSSQIDRDTAAMSNGISSSASGAAKASPARLAASARRNG